MLYPECLVNLVGIGDVGCTSTSFEDISITGLFVTQDPSYSHSRFKSGDTDCDLLSLFIEMRKEAYGLLTKDIAGVLSNKIQTKADSFYDIGQTGSVGRHLNGSEIPATPFVRIKTDDRPGAYIEIQKLGLFLTPINGPFTVNLRVIRESDNELLKTYAVQINSFSSKRTEVPYLKLPCDGDSYIVEYTYDSEAFMVPETNYHCSCGDVIKNAFGFIQAQPSAKSYGISLQVNVACDSGMKICALLRNSDYRNEIGYMLRMKIIELTLQKIYFRQDVNKYTLLTPEDMTGLIETYQAQYTGGLKYIGFQNNFDVDGFCLTCAGGMRKVSLLTGR